MPHFDPDNSTLNKLVDTFLTMMLASYMTAVFLMSAFLLYDPQGSVHLGVLISTVYFNDYVLLRWLINSFQIYLILVFNVSNFIVAVTSFPIGFYMAILITRELRLGRRNYISIHSLRVHGISMRHVFRSFQVLVNVVMGVWGILIFVSHAACTISSVFVNFVLIAYWNQLHVFTKAPMLIGTVVITVVWSTVLEVGSYMCVRGGKVLNSWKRGDWKGHALENKIMSKFRVSCMPIRIAYGHQFVVKRETLLVYFKGVVRGTFRTLLTMKKFTG